MNMVIISIISDSGELKEQCLVKEEEGIEFLLDILRRYESIHYRIHGGYIKDDYERGDILLTKFGCDKLTVYIRKMEVMSTTSPKSAWDFCDS